MNGHDGANLVVQCDGHSDRSCSQGIQTTPGAILRGTELCRDSFHYKIVASHKGGQERSAIRRIGFGENAMAKGHALILEQLAIVRVPTDLKVDGQNLICASHVIVPLPTRGDGLDLIRS